MNTTAIDVTRRIAAQHQADVRRQARAAAMAREASRGTEQDPRPAAVRPRGAFARRRFVPAIRFAR